MKRFLSLLLAACLAVSLTACGGEFSGTAGSTGGTVPMGRWVETEVTPMPSRTIGSPVQLEDGTLWCFCMEPVPDAAAAYEVKLHKYVSADQGSSWQEEPLDWNGETGGVIYDVAVSPNGTALFSSVTKEKSEFWSALPGEAPQPLVLAGFAPEHRLGQYDWLDNDIFYASTAVEQDASGNLYGGEGALFRLSTKEKIADVTDRGSEIGVDGSLFSAAGDGNQLYFMRFTEQGRVLCALQPDGKIQELFSDIPNAGGSGAAAADPDGNYFFAGEKGIFRVTKGGSLVETVVEAGAFSLATPDSYVSSLCKTQNGDFLATVIFNMEEADGGTKLYRYHFDETLPAQNENTLTIWSLDDNATVRAGIVEFGKQHPEITVNYTVVRSGKEPVLAEDALRTLNTELLAGTGPDLLILDGFDPAPYIEKGMLADLSPVIDSAALVKNIAAPYLQAEKTYLLPARFSIPTVFGDAGTVESLTTLEALQTAILDAAPRPDINVSDAGFYDELAENERYGLAFLKLDDLVRFTLQTSSPALLSEEGVQEENLRRALSFIKAVSDHSHLTEYRKEQQYNGTVGSGSGEDTVENQDGSCEFIQTSHARYGHEIIKTTAFVNSISRMDEKTNTFIESNLILQPGFVEGAYLPTALLGVSAASEKQEAALEFVKTLLSEKVQDGFYNDGFPVLQSSLDQMIQRNQPGNKWGKSFKGDISALLQALKTPVVIDEVVQQKLTVHAWALCERKETLDEVVAGVTNELSIYLAEKQ